MTLTDPTPTSAPAAEPTCEVGPWSGGREPERCYVTSGHLAALIDMYDDSARWSVWRDDMGGVFAYGEAPTLAAARTAADAALVRIGVTLAGDAPTLLDEVRRLAPGFAWDVDGIGCVAAHVDDLCLCIWSVVDGQIDASACTTAAHPAERAGAHLTLTNGRHPTVADAVEAVVTAHRNHDVIVPALLRAALTAATKEG